MPFFQKPRRDFLKNIVYGVVAVTISPFIRHSNAKSVTVNHELENCLTKAISEFKVRDMLTNFGIPGDAEITLNMYFGDNFLKNNNLKAAAICPVPSATEKKRNLSKTISVKEFKTALTEKFMDPALIDPELKLGSFFPDENTLTLTFNDQNNNSIEELITVMHCRPGSCGWPWCGGLLVS